MVSASRVDEGYLDSTGDLGRARETGTCMQSDGAAVIWNVLCMHMVRRFCDWPRLPTETGLDKAHVYPTGSSQFVWTVVIFCPTHDPSRMGSSPSVDSPAGRGDWSLNVPGQGVGSHLFGE